VNDRQYRSLAKYAGVIAKELGLAHMDLVLDPGHPGEATDHSEAAASFEGVYGRYRGAIQVNARFETYTPEEQRVCIVHELLHAHTERQRELLRTSLPDAMGRSSYEVFMAAWTQLDELATDAVATAIAPKFPLWEGK
jgi:hypothetical protein